MGKLWGKYAAGNYRLGQLKREAVVCWRDEEGKHRRRLGVFTEIEGRAAVDRFAGLRETLTTRDNQPIGDIFEAYVIDREKDGKLVAAFRDNWKALGPRFAAMQIADITADVCRSYARARFEQGRSPGTVWTELTRLRSALNWALKRRVIPFAPYVWVPSKPPSNQRVLSQEEIWRLYESAVMPHVKLFIALAISTGGRSEAILSLTWDRVDFEGATIDLREAAVINPLTKAVRKGRAVVPMSEEARAILQSHYEGRRGNHVIEWDGEPVKKIRKGFTAAVERAGLGDDVTPHTLRHTVASAASDAGVAMLKISRFLGHRDSKTTEKIYAKSSAASLSDVANVVSIRRKKA